MTEKSLRVGIAGLGHVGSALVDLVQSQGQLRLGGKVEIVGVSARNRNRSRRVSISQYDWFDDPVEMAQSENVDVLVELIGGADGTAKRAVEAALASGKHVVTANKALIAEHGMELAVLAEGHQRNLLFEAAVAGAVPIVRAMMSSLSGSEIKAVRGILNGTCNFLLTEMLETGRVYEDVLADAQRLGYAEADPELDVSGVDAAHKIAILSAIGFGARIDFSKVSVAGVDGLTLLDLVLADKLGYVVKLIAEGTASESGVRCQVSPVVLKPSHPLASVGGSLNAVLVDAEPSGPLTFTGAGAGPGPTASAVMGDISRLMGGDIMPVFGLGPTRMTAPFIDGSSAPAIGQAYYIRANLDDVPGALASLSNALAAASVSVDRLLQDSAGTDGLAPVAITTHPCSRDAAKDAQNRISELACVVDPPRLIRIEP